MYKSQQYSRSRSPYAKASCVASCGGSGGRSSKKRSSSSLSSVYPRRSSSSMGKKIQDAVIKSAATMAAQGPISSIIDSLGSSVSKSILGQGLMATGMGDYTVNDLIHSSGSNADIVPKFTRGTNPGTITISNREYVKDIWTTTTSLNLFNNDTMPINPAIAETFPWLSQIAENYDEYEFSQLIFTYKSSLTESSTAGSVGTLIMAVQYNADADPFTDKQTMLEYSNAVSVKQTGNVLLGVECDQNQGGLKGSLYTRANPVQYLADSKTYDKGILNIATAGSNLVTTAIGELWVSYTVTLRKSKLFSNKGNSIYQDIFVAGLSGIGTYSTAGGLMSLATNGGAGNPVAQLARAQQNNIGCVLTQLNAGANAIRITFPTNFTGAVRITYGWRNLMSTVAGVWIPFLGWNTNGTVSKYQNIPGSWFNSTLQSTANTIGSTQFINMPAAYEQDGCVIGDFLIGTQVGIIANSVDLTMEPTLFGSFAVNKIWDGAHLSIVQINPSYGYKGAQKPFLIDNITQAPVPNVN